MNLKPVRIRPSRPPSVRDYPGFFCPLSREGFTMSRQLATAASLTMLYGGAAALSEALRLSTYVLRIVSSGLKETAT